MQAVFDLESGIALVNHANGDDPNAHPQVLDTLTFFATGADKSLGYILATQCLNLGSSRPRYYVDRQCRTCLLNHVYWTIGYVAFKRGGLSTEELNEKLFTMLTAGPPSPRYIVRAVPNGMCGKCGKWFGEAIKPSMRTQQRRPMANDTWRKRNRNSIR